jgi:hypothetical protein
MISALPVRLSAGGRELEPLGDLYLSEDLYGGCRLAFELPDERQPAVRPGMLVELEVDEERFLLWCFEAGRTRTGSGTSFHVQALDPLGFCAHQRQFTSQAGARPLLDLARDVIHRQAGALEALPAIEGAEPVVQPAWLLQCQETGRELLERVSLLSGHVLYWDRTVLSCATVGRGPAGGADPISLELGPDLVEVRSTREPDHPPQQVLWTDPATRRTQAFNVQGSGLGRGGSTPSTLAQRLSAPASPPEGSRVAVAGWEGCRERLECRTTRPDIGLGTSVAVEGEPARLVTRIEHHVHAQGGYANEVLAVPRDRWGVGRRATSSSTYLLQAVVSHNDDPDCLHRVRVVFAEDPARRSSPWIPALVPVAGADHGQNWLPEVDDLVLVLVTSASPETPVVLGGLRGADSKGTAWRSRENEWKVLAGRGGVQVSINDRRKSLLLEVPDAAVELGPEGVRIETRGRVVIDGTRIDLGL